MFGGLIVIAAVISILVVSFATPPEHEQESQKVLTELVTERLSDLDVTCEELRGFRIADLNHGYGNDPLYSYANDNKANDLYEIKNCGEGWQ